MRLRTLDEVLSADLQDDLCDPDFVRIYLEASLEEAQINNDMGIYELALADIKKANPHTYSDIIERAGIGIGGTNASPAPSQTARKRELAGV